MGARAQAQALADLEQLDAAGTAARAAILGALAAGKGYAADGITAPLIPGGWSRSREIFGMCG